MAWFATSVVLMLVLHDTFFYWLHRLMHTRALFARTHLLHHRSIHPTAYAAYSFSAAEALGEALIVVAIIFIVPQHPLAFLLFQSLSTAYNVYGHCGRELYPPGMDRHWLGRWLNTASLHAHHHRWGRGTTACTSPSGTAAWARWKPARPTRRAAPSRAEAAAQSWAPMAACRARKSCVSLWRASRWISGRLRSWDSFTFTLLPR
jgi:hypothetical protein